MIHDPAFEEAIRNSDVATAINRIRANADVNRLMPEGLTPLMIAAGLGQPQIVEILLAAGAEVLTVEPRVGATALHKAVLSGSADVSALLLNHGAFIDQQSPILGHTALMDAVIYAHRDVVALLLTRGARTSIRNHWGESALDLARRDSHKAIARLIEDRNEADDRVIRGFTLVPAIKEGNIAEVERLLAEGATVDDRLAMTGSLDDDYTPLAIAARAGEADIVRLLLKAGADPRRLIGLFRGTALHEACYFGHAEVVRALIEPRDRPGAYTPDLNAQGVLNGMTPLHDAVWQAHLEAVMVLLDAGVRLDLKSQAGLTPRQLAVLYGYDEIARLLGEMEEASR
jgi:uncharacterized protein